MELSNPPFVDDCDERMEAIHEMPDAPNPLVIGADAYARYQGVLRACAMAKLSGG